MLLLSRASETPFLAHSFDRFHSEWNRSVAPKIRNVGELLPKPVRIFVEVVDTASSNVDIAQTHMIVELDDRLEVDFRS